MIYIDRTNCKTAFEPAPSTDIKALGDLTREATATAERNGLAVLKRRDSAYRIIKACGLGAYEDTLRTLAEVNTFLLNLDKHEATKY